MSLLEADPSRAGRVFPEAVENGRLVSARTPEAPDGVDTKEPLGDLIEVVKQQETLTAANRVEKAWRQEAGDTPEVFTGNRRKGCCVSRERKGADYLTRYARYRFFPWRE